MVRLPSGALWQGFYGRYTRVFMTLIWKAPTTVYSSRPSASDLGVLQLRMCLLVCSMACARERLLVTGLFEACELDFAAMAAAASGVTVLQPQGKRVGAQLPVPRTQ